MNRNNKKIIFITAGATFISMFILQLILNFLVYKDTASINILLNIILVVIAVPGVFFAWQNLRVLQEDNKARNISEISKNNRDQIEKASQLSLNLIQGDIVEQDNESLALGKIEVPLDSIIISNNGSLPFFDIIPFIQNGVGSWRPLFWGKAHKELDIIKINFPNMKISSWSFIPANYSFAVNVTSETTLLFQDWVKMNKERIAQDPLYEEEKGVIIPTYGNFFTFLFTDCHKQKWLSMPGKPPVLIEKYDDFFDNFINVNSKTIELDFQRPNIAIK